MGSLVSTSSFSQKGVDLLAFVDDFSAALVQPNRSKKSLVMLLAPSHCVPAKHALSEWVQ